MSHKSSVKRKKQRKANPPLAGESVKHQNLSLSSSEHISMAAKPKATVAVKSVSYQGVRQELKRSGIIAGIIFLALVILYLLLR